MARAALRWTISDLANRACVGRSTVLRAEADGNAIPATSSAIQRALEAAGVRFIEDAEHVGVMISKASP